MAHPSTTQATKANKGKPLSQLKTVDDLCKRVDALKTHRESLERQWRLNLAFYKGNQYAYYPPRSNRLETLGVEEGSKPRHRVRLISNQIMPGVHTLLAQLTKTKPQLFATPGSGAENEVRAAQLAMSLLDHWYADLSLDEKLDEALLWSIIAGQGYWKLSWDKFAAKQMRFLLDPNGQPILDDALKTEYMAELEKMGIDPKESEKIVYMGDIRIDVLSPFDVYLDPAAKTFEDSKFAICVHHLDTDEVKSRWGEEVEPDAAPSTPDVSLPFVNTPDSPELTVRRVYIGYFKPTAAMPDGRYVVWIEGSDKKILADDKWYFPFNNLPLVKFSGMRVPGSVYDDCPVTHSIPMQKELNRTISQIVEYKNMTINPVMTAPVGSLRTRRTTEPGQVLEYIPVGNMALKPEFEQVQALPPYVFEHLEHISGRLQEVFLSAEVLQGKVPPNVEAGVAIDLLQEMATDKLAPIVRLIESSLARAGQQMLALAQKYYIEPRLLKIRGSGGSVQVKQFANSDIVGNITVRAEVGSGLPRTRAGRQARIERFVELGIIPPNKAAKYIDVADLKGIEQQLRADEDFAYRNIDKIVKGEIINPESLMSAWQSLEQGINPETGETIQSMQEAEAILQKAAFSPPTGIDVDVHLDVTRLFLTSLEFEKLDSEKRMNFITYFENLRNSTQPALPPAEAPRVSYQLRGTLGPSAATKVLQNTGVPVTVEDLAEPPLETWVTDSVDKPDTDAAGPGQEANQLSEAAKVMMEVKIADAEAKHAAAMKQLDQESNVAEKVRTSAIDTAAKIAEQLRQDELHKEQLRKAKADADLAEKKAKQPLAPKNEKSNA